MPRGPSSQMCKRGGTTGSGSMTWFNGWINICFPFILDRPNHFTVPYSPDAAYVKEGRDGGVYGMHAPQGVQVRTGGPRGGAGAS